MTEPGDVVFFHEEAVHAAFGGRPGRHRQAVNFAAHPRTEEQLDLVRELYARHRFGFHPAGSCVNSDNPRLRSMVAFPVEMGFETFRV